MKQIVKKIRFTGKYNFGGPYVLYYKGLSLRVSLFDMLNRDGIIYSYKGKPVLLKRQGNPRGLDKTLVTDITDIAYNSFVGTGCIYLYSDNTVRVIKNSVITTFLLILQDILWRR